MWIVCITSVRHVLTVNGYGGRQTKENEKSWCFKGWETLDNKYIYKNRIFIFFCSRNYESIFKTHIFMDYTLYIINHNMKIFPKNNRTKIKYDSKKTNNKKNIHL